MTGLAAGTNGEDHDGGSPASPDSPIVEGRPAANTAHERIRELHRRISDPGDAADPWRGFNEAQEVLLDAFPAIADALEAADAITGMNIVVPFSALRRLRNALDQVNEKLS